MRKLVISFLGLKLEGLLYRGIFWVATGYLVFVIFVFLKQIWAHFEEC